MISLGDRSGVRTDRSGGGCWMNKGRYTSLGLALLLFVLATGCAAGEQLRTEGTAGKAIQGTFDLYLYGCRYPGDIENVAILVAVDSPYHLEIYDLPGRYKVKKGLPAEKALADANAFVRCSMKTVMRSEIREIEDDQGRIFGFDVRPLYMPYEIRAVDVMRISYVLAGGRVTAYIKLAPGAGEDDGFLRNRMDDRRR